ncbi:MAG: hypothetical protein COU69_00575 [Candidatus Pacebacteria bacterium CG10_big_fil_rev_8_21_14_0_10_56_10]|nr:MAG: hypothetical protein COU69_00575 [Candidatus Pacebacteria bacterium CG10_big_fil_rev_8_21_14_0_10_56_10]
MPSQPSSRKLVKHIKPTQQLIEELQLPVTTHFSARESNAHFDAVEMDQFRRIYTFQHIEQDLTKWLLKYAADNNKKIIALGLTHRHKHSELASSLWLKHDIVPYISHNRIYHTVEELIETAQLTAAGFAPDLSSHPQIYDYNRVIPSYLVKKEDYQQTVDEASWQQLLKLKRAVNGKKIRFFSATPQGGGVALMRHAMIRLFRLIGVNVTWHVMCDNPEVFKITKSKFHNVLQHVAPENVKLTAADKKVFEGWSKFNAEYFEPKLKDCDLVVIDDPQPLGLIPHIKKINPKAKLIYRSHIQVRSDLVNQQKTPQRTTWEYINFFAKQADVFISHPVREFVPDSVDMKSAVTMPAVTDPLDGLNKPLSKGQEEFYLKLFNKYLIESQQSPLDLDREHLIQIARFDPSKGIPDLLEAYRLLCAKLPAGKRPQLVIAGHGSVDDPDGIPILNYINELLIDKKFAGLAEDIKIARLPHVDQPLNALLRRAKICLQLSHREGFEVKVTEALMKGVPVVVYRAGGIPLQVAHGRNGFVIDQIGDVEAVAEVLHQLIANPDKCQAVHRHAQRGNYQRYQTVANARRWLWLAQQLLKEGHVQGEGRSVDELMGK